MKEYNTPHTPQPVEPQWQQEDSLDIKGIIFKFLRHWYWFALTIFVALVAAHLFNRYSEPVYEASGTVLVSKDNQEQPNIMSPGRGMSFRPHNLMENEMALIRSYDMRRNAALQMNWYTTIIRQGKFFTSEMYTNRPFKVEFDTNHVQAANISFHVVLNDLESYQLKYGTGSEVTLYNYRTRNEQRQRTVPETSKTLRFGQWYITDHCAFRLVLNDDYSAYQNVNTPPDNHQEFWITFNTLESAVQKFGAYGIERPDRYADVLKVSMSGKNEHKAIAQVNALLTGYVKQNLDEKNQRSVNTINFIDEQLRQLTDTLGKVEQNLQDFQSEHSMLEIQDKAHPAFQKINELESKRAMERLKQNYYQFLSDYVDDSKGERKSLLAPSTIGIEDQMLTSLVQSLNDLYTRRSELLITSTENDPRVLALQRRVEQAEAALLENISNIMAHSRITVEDLNERIAELQSQIRGLPLKERQLVSIQRRFQVNDQIYTFLLQRRAEAGIEKSANMPDYKIIDEARGARKIFPKTSMNYAISFIIGLLLPLIVILLRDFFDNKVHSHEDIEKNTNVPVLGIVNHSKLTANTSVILKPRSILSESYRSLRTSLQFYYPKDNKANVVTITSTFSGEGKTFTAINLSSIYALSGKKTLLLSADLRKPKVYEDFGLSNDKGLSTYLIGKCNKEEIIQFSGYDNLYVVTSGPVPPHPSELLETQKMADLLEELRDEYDHIVVDTPPIGLVTDAIYLMSRSHANIYVVRQNFTPKNALDSLKEMLKKTKVKNVSAILNDVEISKSAYGSYGYGYGYGYAYGGYYSDEEMRKPGLQNMLKGLFKRSKS